MKAYSRDLRVRALDALDLGTPRPEVMRLFGVSTATLTRWRRRQRETGSLAESPRSGPPGRKTVGLSAALPARLAAQPDATLEEHRQWWEGEAGVRVSHATMSRAITRLGWTREKSLGEPASATRRSGPPGGHGPTGSSRTGSSGSTRPAATSA